jgi:hypothetical protein
MPVLTLAPAPVESTDQGATRTVCERPPVSDWRSVALRPVSYTLRPRREGEAKAAACGHGCNLVVR